MLKLFISLTLILASQCLWAQELVPATSEDLQEFDRQVSRLKDATGKRHDKASAFGAQVKEEAAKLNESSLDEKKDFGKWVSGQKKKDSQGRPPAEGSFGAGSTTAGSKRAQPSVPDKARGKKPN